MTPLLVMLGAGTGAATRYLAGHLLDARFPPGHVAGQCRGSSARLARRARCYRHRLVAAGRWVLRRADHLTPAFAVRTVDLARESWLRSTTYVVATLALSLAACFVGFAIS